MLNFITTDIKRALQSKELWIIIACILLAMTIITYGSKSLNDLPYENYMAGRRNTDGVHYYEEHLESIPEDQLTKDYYDHYMTSQRETYEPRAFQEMGASFSLFLLAILAGLSIGRDFSTGFLKNLVNLPNGRINWFIGKLFMLATFAFLLNLAMALFSLVLTRYMGNEISNLQGLMENAGIMFIYNWLFTILVAAVVIIFNSGTLGIVVGILYAAGFQKVIYNLFNSINIDLSQFDLQYLFQTALMGTMERQGILLSIALFIVGISLGGFFIKKQDLQI